MVLAATISRTSGEAIFRQVCLRQVGRPAPQDLVLLLQQPDPLVRLAQLLALLVFQAGSVAVSDIGPSHPAVQAALEIPKSFAIWFSGAWFLRAPATTSSQSSWGWGFGLAGTALSEDGSS